MEWLQYICNIIIIIGGAGLAIKNIFGWLGIPFKGAKKKTDKVFEKKVVSVVQQILPDLLIQHDKETRERYLADREAYLQQIKKEVLSNVQEELHQIGVLAKQYDALVISAKDVLREKIMQIYFKNKPTKTLTLHEKEALDQYYIDYKAIKGNTYIDKYYKRMERWQVLDDDDDLDN